MTQPRPGARRVDPAARWWFAIAGIAALISLGLPWKTTVELGFGFTYYIGLCYNSYDYDGWMTTYCDPYWNPQLEVKPGMQDMIGAAHPVRVLLALVVIALLLGYRRNQLALLKAAPLLAGFGLVGYRITGMAGQIAFGIGLAALLIALHRDGVLVRRPGRLSSVIRPAPLR